MLFEVIAIVSRLDLAFVGIRCVINPPLAFGKRNGFLFGVKLQSHLIERILRRYPPPSKAPDHVLKQFRIPEPIWIVLHGLTAWHFWMAGIYGLSSYQSSLVFYSCCVTTNIAYAKPSLKRSRSEGKAKNDGKKGETHQKTRM